MFFVGAVPCACPVGATTKVAPTNLHRPVFVEDRDKYLLVLDPQTETDEMFHAERAGKKSDYHPDPADSSRRRTNISSDFEIIEQSG